jgi:hypothetical protein
LKPFVLFLLNGVEACLKGGLSAFIQRILMEFVYIKGHLELFDLTSVNGGQHLSELHEKLY